MSLLPKQTLNDIVDSDFVVEPFREYIGYSGSGNPCARAIWYDFHWVTVREISPRLKRIFETGHMSEHFMIKSLMDSGIEVSDEQKRVHGHYGHVKGHIDGIVDNVPGFEHKMLLEMKTMNDSNFKQMKKEGCKRCKPTYYTQQQMYMGKLELTNSLLMVYNKNTSEYYFEVVPFDKNHYDLIESKIFDILTAEFPPDKIGNKTWFECKMCNHRDVCHSEYPVFKTCRSCEKGTIEDDGKWTCDGNKELDKDEQESGCERWSILEGL